MYTRAHTGGAVLAGGAMWVAAVDSGAARGVGAPVLGRGRRRAEQRRALRAGRACRRALGARPRRRRAARGLRRAERRLAPRAERVRRVLCPKTRSSVLSFLAKGAAPPLAWDERERERERERESARWRLGECFRISRQKTCAASAGTDDLTPLLTIVAADGARRLLWAACCERCEASAGDLNLFDAARASAALSNTHVPGPWVTRGRSLKREFPRLLQRAHVRETCRRREPGERVVRQRGELGPRRPSPEEVFPPPSRTRVQERERERERGFLGRRATRVLFRRSARPRLARVWLFAIGATRTRPLLFFCSSASGKIPPRKNLVETAFLSQSRGMFGELRHDVFARHAAARGVAGGDGRRVRASRARARRRVGGSLGRARAASETQRLVFVCVSGDASSRLEREKRDTEEFCWETATSSRTLRERERERKGADSFFA